VDGEEFYFQFKKMQNGVKMLFWSAVYATFG